MSTEIIGGYRLRNLMMTGQTSQVWEVVELTSNRHFAMKMLLPEKARSAEHRRFLFHEAEVGRKLAHPNIIRIYSVVKDAANPYFIMEFFPAGSLKLRLIRRQTDWVKERLQSILKQVATAMAYMNASGWVHRDLKPDNILCNNAGEVRIIDFALARRVQKKGLFGGLFKRKAKTQGTRTYMSPEQIRSQPLDGRADIYSFGVSAYELATGRPPFRGLTAQDLLNRHLAEKATTPSAYNPDLTDDFCAFLLRMLAKKREDRPKDFHEVLMQLRNMRIFKSQAAQPAAGESG
ncbi:MAG TPA: serine/threonine-protein kinase [Gemmataceae bacterium]|nr:serine/threonine-protein kinase [Gemmataceae bacterium]